MKLQQRGKGPKTYVHDNKTYLKPHKAALATPENGPQEKQSTTNWHKNIKAAKVFIPSRVNQSLLNKFFETIIVDLKKNNKKNNNIVSCIKVNAIS